MEPKDPVSYTVLQENNFTGKVKMLFSPHFLLKARTMLKPPKLPFLESRHSKVIFFYCHSFFVIKKPVHTNSVKHFCLVMVHEIQHIQVVHKGGQRD